ncbi:MAG: YcjF family protein [Pseudorhodoplanes sp.]
MSTKARAPTAFSLRDSGVVITESDDNPREDIVQVRPETEANELALPAAMPKPPKRFSWASLFWCATGGLILLGMGLGIAHLIEDLFARSQILGWTGAALAAVASIALVAVGIREIRSLWRLSTIEELREHAAATIQSDDRSEGASIVQTLLRLTRNMPQLARARHDVEIHLGEIIDGADLIRLAERNLMAPLDQEARRLVTAAAKRVSIVTAVSPRAVVDMLFVLATILGLLRRLAYLYGGRPGTLGLVRLLRLCIAHLTVTGGLAMGDTIIQQMVGQGVMAKLSTRLGEGMLNGMLTARVGLAAIEVMRPLPYAVLPQPTLSNLAAELLKSNN